MKELLFEAPKYAVVKKVVVETHEIALNIELDREGLAGIVFGGLANMMSETFLSVERSFADTTRIRVGAKMSIPPISADIIEKMVDDAITERGGNDFSGDGVMDDEGDAATGFIIMTNEAITKVDDVFHGAEFELMLIDGLAFALASGIIGNPKFMAKEFFQAFIVHVFWSVVAVCCIHEG